MLKSLACIVPYGSNLGCAANAHSDILRSQPFLELGASSDGIGIRLESELDKSNIQFRQEPGIDLIMVGGCGHCMKLQVESLPNHDASGRLVVVGTTDRGTYTRLRKELNKPAILDSDERLHKRLNALVFPRRYILNPSGAITASETGDSTVDRRHGFDEM